jgi:hypothetical protein
LRSTRITSFPIFPILPIDIPAVTDKISIGNKGETPMALDIDFAWYVDEKGYRLDHGRIVGNGGRKRWYRLEKYPTLYLVFAKIQQTPEGLLDFVNKFGRLTVEEAQQDKSSGRITAPDEIGDNVRKMLSSAKYIAATLELARSAGGTLPKWEGDKPPEFESHGVTIQGGIPVGTLTAWLLPNPATGAWEFRLRPHSLLNAITLQVGVALTSKAALKQCDHCGTWFEAGAGVGKRRDARFCSTECKTTFHSHKRKRSAEAEAQ